MWGVPQCLHTDYKLSLQLSRGNYTVPPTSIYTLYSAQMDKDDYDNSDISLDVLIF